MASTFELRRAVEHAPWSATAWRDTTFVASGVPLHFVGWTVLTAIWWVWQPVNATPIMIAVLVPCAAFLGLIRPLTRAQRERCWAMLGIDIPPLRFDGRSLPDLRSVALWRQVRYHLVSGPLVACGGLLLIGLWAGGLALALNTTYAWALPQSSVLSLTAHAIRAGFLTVIGVLFLVAAPWAATGLRKWDARSARALLGPDRADELERRVEDLAEKRASVVDAADLERRRIERDLHDGAQQRLVSLAMNLGLARETLKDVPDDAMQVIVEAHEEAKEALTELRDLIRGLHPAVLEDRGLDAALSGIAARVPLPVRLHVDVPRRASSTVEAVAYFVVSEALTNVVKHARASKVDVTVDRVGDVLKVVVCDDGAGGADPAGGSGLAGLTRRVSSVDGTFRITSPAGGPTTITVELPCAL
ncbi:sensor domain-containing protein [Actinomadura barringtoniae]|uniref:histidine kinase n=1 Tax=Actinomadura barringtoniae TaxID=1427535 RepID=A0A939PFD0_9ACTN|nr:histidine kinase [Actinomadura barringtoniae]MBO2451827.1 sensor domain-containing protein [Actinomadura barringtoniae]